MMEFLDKLKQKPEHVRRQIALGLSILLSSIIILMWWNVWTNDSTHAEREKAADETENISPTSGLMEMLRFGKTSVTESISSLRDASAQLESASGTMKTMEGEADTEGGRLFPQNATHSKETLTTHSTSSAFE